VLESTSLRTEIEKGHGLGSYYSLDNCHFRILEHPLLSYPCATLGTCKYSFSHCNYHCQTFKKLLTHIDEQCYVELIKLSVRDRPRELDRFVRGTSQAQELTFTRPASWTYLNDEVVKYLKDLLNECDSEFENAVKRWLQKRSEL
jgi:hypothetical protein